MKKIGEVKERGKENERRRRRWQHITSSFFFCQPLPPPLLHPILSFSQPLKLQLFPSSLDNEFIAEKKEESLLAVLDSKSRREEKRKRFQKALVVERTTCTGSTQLSLSFSLAWLGFMQILGGVGVEGGDLSIILVILGREK